MKVRASAKPICEKCKVIKRRGTVMLSAPTLSINKNRAKKKIL